MQERPAHTLQDRSSMYSLEMSRPLPYASCPASAAPEPVWLRYPPLPGEPSLGIYDSKEGPGGVRERAHVLLAFVIRLALRLDQHCSVGMKSILKTSPRRRRDSYYYKAASCLAAIDIRKKMQSCPCLHRAKCVAATPNSRPCTSPHAACGTYNLFSRFRPTQWTTWLCLVGMVVVRGGGIEQPCCNG